MTNTAKIITVAVIVALAAGAVFYFTSAPEVAAPSLDAQDTLDNGAGGIEPAQTDSYTMAEVASHSAAGDCWTIVRGEVYNLTSWISQHPGGQEAILKLCGKDGTEAFTGKHGGSEKQESTLTSFRIGALAQ